MKLTYKTFCLIRTEVSSLNAWRLGMLIVAFFCVAVLFSSCAELFQPKIPMVSGTNGSLNNIFTEEKEITKLQPSAQVFVSAGLSANSINVVWEPVNYAVSYCVERAVQKPADEGYSEDKIPEDFEVINKAVYGTAFTDFILTNPSYNNEEYNYKYWYRVYAENNRKKYEASEPAVCTSYGNLFAPPQKVDATKGESSEYIKVSWAKAQNADEYVVFRTKNANGTGAEEKVKVPANQNWYTDFVETAEQGIDFYYIVKAVNKSGVLSASSNIGFGYSSMEGAPSKPEPVNVLTRGTSKSEIKLKWNAVSSGEGEVKYTVLRYSSVDSTLTQLKAGTLSCEYTDNNVKPGIMYYYQIQAWVEDNGKKLKSPISEIAPFNGNEQDKSSSSEGFLLSPPSLINVEAGQTVHKITWEPAVGHQNEQSLYSYEIYGSQQKEQDYIFIKTTAAGELSAEIPIASSYKFYYIKTFNAGISSAESEIVAPSPFAAKGLSVSKAKNLGDSYQANSSGVYPVELEWQAPDGGAVAYNVYRSASQDSGFRKITEKPVTECYFIDTNDTAKAGKYYYYRVLSLNELEQGNKYSETKYGYGALTHEQYILEYNKTIKSSQKKMTYLNKPGSTDKIGSETVNGDISGNVFYNAAISGLGARIIIRYTDYADFYIDGNKELGNYFILSGESNTSASMDASGKMDSTVVCKGMYPGKISYDNIQIKGGNAGGGTYGVCPDGFAQKELDWKILN